MQLFLGYNHLQLSSNLKLSKTEIANTSQYWKKVEIFLRQQFNDWLPLLKLSCDWFQSKWLLINPYSFRSFLHTNIYTLIYSYPIADYLRKVLFNHSKIVYVSAAMSIIDNYGTLFTAQNISAKLDNHSAVKSKSTEAWERWALRLPGKN